MTDNLEPKFGVHLLGTITRGMYSNPLHCIREYVQNAYDSIREARRQKILGNDDGIVKIVVDPNTKTLKIRDNGTGLDPESAVVRLIDLGSSPKATSVEGSTKNAGFRGIGRMAGITYCDVLRFETSDGKGKKTVVTFNAKEINKLTEIGKKPSTIVRAINDNCQIEEVDSTNDHYFEVILDGLKSDSIFLCRDKLEEYLGQVGPVQFDPKAWKFTEKIKSIAATVKKEESLEHITIQICNADGSVFRDVRRLHKDKFQSQLRGKKDRQVEISEIEPIPLVGGATGDFWGWLAVHEWKNQLKVPHAGLRIRMHNIEIGDDRLVRELFKSPNLATWCFGEIHITNFSITPNAQRDNFQESKNWNVIKRRLKDDISKLEKRLRDASKTRNTNPAELLKRAEKNRKKVQRKVLEGIESKEEQNLLVEKLRKQEETLLNIHDKLQRDTTGEERQQLTQKIEDIQKLREDIQTVKRTHSDEAMAHLDRRTRKVVKKIFNVLQDELEENVFFNLQKKINEAIKPGQIH